MLCFLLNQCCFILQGIFFPPNSFVLEALIYVQFVLYSGIEILTRILAWLRSWRQIWGKDGKCHICIPKNRRCKYYYEKWAFTIFADLLLGLGLGLGILQHIYRVQICENPIFRPVHKHYVIIACCEDIYSHHCIQKSNNDHFLLLSAIITFKMKSSLFSVV